MRDAAGLGFEPAPREGAQLRLMDAKLDWARPTRPDRMWMFFHEGGYLGINPAWGGHHHIWRFEGVEAPREDDPTLDEMQETIRRITGDETATLTDCKWTSHVAAPRTGVAPGLRAGRAFLAGDAGHVALPVGGQGMNTGVQDALALGWRLAEVVLGLADARLMGGYEPERHAIRRGLYEDQVGQLDALLDPGLKEKVGMKVLGPLLSKITGAAEFGGGRDAAMLELSYDDGPQMVTAARGGMRPGERMPEAVLRGPEGDMSLHDAIYRSGWLHFAFGDGPPLPGIRSHVVTGDPSRTGPRVWHDLDGVAAERTGLGDGDAVLVRPDGYVGWRGDAADVGGAQAYLGAMGYGA